ncbi:MAG: hypothetical protein ABH914_01265 [Candidatus Omnitrophota bacterium]
MKRIIYFLIILLFICSAFYIIRFIKGNNAIKEVVARLEADSRIAQILVTNVSYDEASGKNLTTIKFLEYDTKKRPLNPKYFTFPGNIIQFQSLVVRFDDLYVRKKDLLRGRSAYLFWKVFMLDGANTIEQEITKLNQIPPGYKIENINNPFEEKLWREFWKYALNPKEAKKIGIKNAQIEAPGVMFIPGTLYTIKIEHDGGIRIDSQPLPDILKGERIPG